MSALRVATWNAGHRRDSWKVLLDLDADIVLAQELPPPSNEERERTVFASFDPPKKGGWGTAVWARDLPLRPLPTSTGIAALARAGIVAAGEVTLPGSGVLTAFSLHAVDEPFYPLTPGTLERDEPKGYPTAVTHRALTDLTGYLMDPRRKGGRGYGANLTVLGGDLNCNLGYDDTPKSNGAHRALFDRIAAYGLTPVIPPVAGDTHTTIVRSRIPFRQIDYLYASENVSVANAHIDDGPQLRARGDHLPVHAQLVLPALRKAADR